MKKATIFSILTTGAAIAVISIACNKNNTVALQASTPKLPAAVYNYQSKNSRVNNHKATLGRVLFYDKNLSANGAVACGSCHKQSNGFADNAKVSTGFSNVETGRNSLAVQNLSLGGDSFINIDPITGKFNNIQHLFWDGRSKSVQDLMLRPVVNHIEMGQDINKLADKLNRLPYYAELSQNAYGSSQLTTTNIIEAMSQFVASIRTNDTPVDLFFTTGNKASLMGQALLGASLFTSAQYNCVSCHTSISAGQNIDFGGGVYGGGIDDSTRQFAANIGLSSTDNGIEEVSKRAADKGMFKIPDLHNVALTAPYMHDGRFNTLDDVLEHYSHGILPNANLDNRLKTANGAAKVMNIPDGDKRAIIAFLNSLTSTKSIGEPMYSNPFTVK